MKTTRKPDNKIYCIWTKTPITTTAGLEPGPFPYDTQSMAIGTGQEFFLFFSLLFALTNVCRCSLLPCLVVWPKACEQVKVGRWRSLPKFFFFSFFSFWYSTRHWILRWIDPTTSDGQTVWLTSQQDWGESEGGQVECTHGLTLHNLLGPHYCFYHHAGPRSGFSCFALLLLFSGSQLGRLDPRCFVVSLLLGLCPVHPSINMISDLPSFFFLLPLPLCYIVACPTLLCASLLLFITITKILRPACTHVRTEWPLLSALLSSGLTALRARGSARFSLPILVPPCLCLRLRLRLRLACYPGVFVQLHATRVISVWLCGPCLLVCLFVSSRDLWRIGVCIDARLVSSCQLVNRRLVGQSVNQVSQQGWSVEREFASVCARSARPCSLFVCSMQTACLPCLKNIRTEACALICLPACLAFLCCALTLWLCALSCSACPFYFPLLAYLAPAGSQLERTCLYLCVLARPV
ncbi:hypothetical protein IWX90DRAFT_12700 [Phyllosticta citrichinensis]|uniref:Uncharacterized protein n=1 Tax=Phyllosticta citrichinensis TaxID=1130410 RepID=A0ABR1Y743_9PEZI